MEASKETNYITTENGQLVYNGEDFKIRLVRYTDPERKNAARNAARYLGKPDLDNVKRPLNVIQKGHVPEIFRGEFAEFEFEDVSKEVYDHLVTYTTRNMRVAGGNRALESEGFHMPSDRVKNPLLVEEKISSSMQNYKDLLMAGETKQVSRSAMPVNAKMNIFVYQFNFLTLAQSLFKQRIWEKGAQGNTVQVVKGMFMLCHTMDSELWDTFYNAYGEPATVWSEVRRKLERKNIGAAEFISIFNEQVKKENIPEQASLVDVLGHLYGNVKSMWG